jgi:DNA-binding MarR family transcriptional regulator
MDDTGTTVARLAQRAQMTKHAMAELVAHLEKHGYVVRRSDPRDRRAKSVMPTARGRDVYAIARGVVPEIEEELDSLLGPRRAAALREDLDLLRCQEGANVRICSPSVDRATSTGFVPRRGEASRWAIDQWGRS